jgi:uroporphyrin-III C-methyltransferase / precorrin-2 dehydrogenase / sirohydrochlorin ferrochelatase
VARSSYPVVLTDLQMMTCLVVGGGMVAERKITALLEAEAQVTVVSPAVTPTISRWADDGRLRCVERPFEADDVLGCALVIAATNDRQVNAAVARTARAAGVLVNVVDDPDGGSFITPATVRRGDLVVSVTTGGQSPALAALVRRTLERTIGAEYATLLDLLGTLRRDGSSGNSPAARAVLQRTLANDQMLEWLRTGQHERALAYVAEHVGAPREQMEATLHDVGGVMGKVSLVGAGPGDPELITLRGLRLLQTADAVVYDDLANDALLEQCAPNAEHYPMGKRGGKGGTPQNEINELLVRLAQEGKHVVRLKGGDPYVFGRGAEEASILQDHGIPWEVVSGVSSGVAVPASAGIPVTLRGWASSVVFVTGNADPAEPAGIDWRGIATSVDTIVIFMGVRHLRAIMEQLVAGGRAPSTPAAMIEGGTLDAQRSVTATLGTIADAAAAARLSAPAIVVVGEVVAARLPDTEVDERSMSDEEDALARNEHTV